MGYPVECSLCRGTFPNRYVRLYKGSAEKSRRLCYHCYLQERRKVRIENVLDLVAEVPPENSAIELKQPDLSAALILKIRRLIEPICSECSAQLSLNVFQKVALVIPFTIFFYVLLAILHPLYSNLISPITSDFIYGGLVWSVFQLVPLLAATILVLLIARSP